MLGILSLSWQNVHRVMLKRESKVDPLLKIWPYSQKECAIALYFSRF